MTSVLNQKAARRVSIIAQKPVLVKSATIASSSSLAAAVAPVSSAPTLKKSSSTVASIAQTSSVTADEVAMARKDKEMLEQQIALLRKSAQENEEKNSQLSSHVGVLEDLLEQKKEHLDYIEARLEAMGLDPVTVTAFEIDSTIEREIYLKEQAQSFDERLKQLKQSVNRRNELVADTLKALQVISETLEELEKQQ